MPYSSAHQLWNIQQLEDDNFCFLLSLDISKFQILKNQNILTNVAHMPGN